MNGDLLTNERCAIVTGANSGIGRAIVTRLLADGFHVVANVFASEGQHDDEEQFEPGVEVLWGDLTQEDDAAQLAARSLEKHGRIDVLVNTAGGGAVTPILDLTLEQWRRMIDSNLTTAFVASRAVIAPMIDQQHGRIVNISSQLAFKGSPELAHYSAAKAGLGGLTRSLALALAPHRITVNAVAPGPIATSGHRHAGVTPDALAKQIDGLPLKRLGQPDEIAGAISYLAGDLGGFVTGQTIHVNGGDIMP